jgi:hypothetical protein
MIQDSGRNILRFAMVQTIPISEKTTLKYLRENFNLQRNDDRQFFPEWYENLQNISDGEQVFLDRISSRYFYQLDEGTLLEGRVKMMMVAPLLVVCQSLFDRRGKG